MGRPMYVTAVTACTAVLALSACVQRPQPLYRWGSYETLVYQMYEQPGKAEPGAQVQQLTADIERAQAEGKRVPPGVHAHLGYMHFMQGDTDAAADEFATERALYPESDTFMTTFLSRLQTGDQP
ncbi:DUF4810 domain-containing protein [Salinisphaera sp. T31B1]|uniref:DUF4810 domain-containing protein n=1 Tax=Salinisphaera sp. T31B1 TaxID=727963 RepID=UPI003340A5C8